MRTQQHQREPNDFNENLMTPKRTQLHWQSPNNIHRPQPNNIDNNPVTLMRTQLSATSRTGYLATATVPLSQPGAGFWADQRCGWQCEVMAWADWVDRDHQETLSFHIIDKAGSFLVHFTSSTQLMAHTRFLRVFEDGFHAMGARSSVGINNSHFDVTWMYICNN